MNTNNKNYARNHIWEYFEFLNLFKSVNAKGMGEYDCSQPPGGEPDVLVLLSGSSHVVGLKHTLRSVMSNLLSFLLLNKVVVCLCCLWLMFIFFLWLNWLINCVFSNSLSPLACLHAATYQTQTEMKVTENQHTCWLFVTHKKTFFHSLSFIFVCLFVC